MNARALESADPEPGGSDSSSSECNSDEAAVPASFSRPMKRILLVDDQAHVLRVMRLSLDRNGYEVETALNTEVALRLLHATCCDAIITGMDLPSDTARQLCESVQKHFPRCSPFCLVASSLPHDSSELAWIDGMCNTELLPSPLSLRWVVARLSLYFGTI